MTPVAAMVLSLPAFIPGQPSSELGLDRYGRLPSEQRPGSQITPFWMDRYDTEEKGQKGLAFYEQRKPCVLVMLKAECKRSRYGVAAQAQLRSLLENGYTLIQMGWPDGVRPFPAHPDAARL